MGIKTADMVKGLPGKEITADVDWLGILDSFEPSQLEEKYINECARRNSYDTCYRWDTPPRPIEERNPFWLFDTECEAYYAYEDIHAEAVQMKDEPCIYATVDVILRWIKEGKPRDTCWSDAYL